MKHSPDGAQRSLGFSRIVGRIFAVLGLVLLAAVILFVGIIGYTCKGPSVRARDLFVTTVQENDLLRILPRFFLTQAEVDAILADNRLLPTGEVSDTSFGFIESEDPDAAAVQVVDIQGEGYRGKLLIVADPSRMELSCLSSFDGSVGAAAEDFAKQSGAVAAVTAGSGATPFGYVIQNGDIIYGDKQVAAPIIAFDERDHLLVGSITAEQALAKGVRNAICVENSTIIVNGKSAEIAGIGDGLHLRAAIGQRADGAVLMMVLEGEKPSSLGVSLQDCIREMLKAGAVNAAVMNSTDAATIVYENKPLNTASDAADRRAPVAFVVK